MTHPTMLLLMRSPTDSEALQMSKESVHAEATTTQSVLLSSCFFLLYVLKATLPAYGEHNNTETTSRRKGALPHWAPATAYMSHNSSSGIVHTHTP